MQILFAVLMGLRRGEINGLKYSDVDKPHIENTEAVGEKAKFQSGGCILHYKRDTYSGLYLRRKVSS